ncbi:MAG: hypothetical protein AAF393_16440 [Pseudomonadota bacterium]
MRVAIGVLCVLALGACQPRSPDDGSQFYTNVSADPSALQREETRLADAEAGIPTGPQQPAATETAAASQPVATQTAGAVDTSKPTPQTAANTIPERPNPPPADPNNIAAYAIAQTHPVGTKKYKRSVIGISNCRRYRDNPDAAQREFLKAGGPEKDPKRLDRDGDGYACDWDPEPFRRLLRASQTG